VEGVEYALVKLASGARYLVKGGRDGIDIMVGEQGSRRTLQMQVEGRLIQVVRIYGHSHPRVTGPSDGDLEALSILGQRHSYLFEFGGDRRGTRIEPKRHP
jgi:hypothetical protein